MDNPEIQKAWATIANTNYSLFLTGKAGTGKTTFLHKLREELPKRNIVCAPTGIAAINARGVTLHSFFQLSFSPFIPNNSLSNQLKKYAFRKNKIKLIRSIEVLIIDEISMVRADVLDAVDSVLRQYRRHDLPFGGVQLLLIGDLMQLSPVTRDEDWQILKQYYDTPFFFSSHALQQLPHFTIELTKVYRQSDKEFIGILNSVREGIIDPTILQKLNTRYIPDFTPKKEDGYICLTSHNRQADTINQRELNMLKGKEYSYDAKVDGDFPTLSYPTDAQLTLKVGAQVMFVRNDSNHQYYNGMIGEIVNLTDSQIEIRPTHGETTITLKPTTWENTQFILNEETEEVEEKIIGTFTQYPLRLAWAITIHKSQGLTFDHAIIDARHCFAAGQTYVALSRCRSFEGLVLSSQIGASAILTDHDVNQYQSHIPEHTPSDEQLKTLAKNYFMQTACEVFCFKPLMLSFNAMLRVLEEHFYKLYPKLLETFRKEQVKIENELYNVGETFGIQIKNIVQQAAEDYTQSELLQERMHKAAPYFIERIQQTNQLVKSLNIEPDSKRIEQIYTAALERLSENLKSALALLSLIDKDGFNLQKVLRLKAEILFTDDSDEEPTTSPKNEGKKESKTKTQDETPADILHPELFERLRKWRNATAQEKKIAPYMVFSQKALLALSNLMPTTTDQLKHVPHVGKTIIKKYGESIIEIISEYKD